jgi:hypothetical protein
MTRPTSTGRDDARPRAVQRYRRRWPLRLVARPLYWLAVLVASNVVADPVATGGPSRVSVARGRLVVAGVKGPIASRLLRNEPSGWRRWLTATVYGPKVQWESSERGVRLMPDGEMAREAIRDIEIPAGQIAGSTSGRYSSRHDWIELDLGTEGRLTLLVAEPRWAP